MRKSEILSQSKRGMSTKNIKLYFSFNLLSFTIEDKRLTPCIGNDIMTTLLTIFVCQNKNKNQKKFMKIYLGKKKKEFGKGLISLCMT